MLFKKDSRRKQKDVPEVFRRKKDGKKAILLPNQKKKNNFGLLLKLGIILGSFYLIFRDKKSKTILLNFLKS